MRNVEVKAKSCNQGELLVRIASLAGSAPTVIIQKDTFFEAASGRLKLRVEEMNGTKTSSLIFYNRPNTAEAKLSNYEIVPVIHPDSLRSTLARAYGIKGEVEKTRQVFFVGQTRVHVDSVRNLGEYVELEVVLSEGESVEDGRVIAGNLMEKLGIQRVDLIAGSYLDMMTPWTSFSHFFNGEKTPGGVPSSISDYLLLGGVHFVRLLRSDFELRIKGTATPNQEELLLVPYMAKTERRVEDAISVD